MTSLNHCPFLPEFFPSYEVQNRLVGLCKKSTEDGVDHGEMPLSLSTKTPEISGDWPILKSTINLICVRNLSIEFKFLHCQIRKEAQIVRHFTFCRKWRKSAV